MDPNLPQPLNNIDGEDIAPIFDPAWQAAGIPRVLALACVLAESGLNPHAERWGKHTTAARSAIQWGDHAWLQSIINAGWADISFGYAQRIVAYHYLGDRSATVDNCLAVRAAVFANPARALAEMCNDLATVCLPQISGVNLSIIGGDRDLGALIVYNAGHWPDPLRESDWWVDWRGNVEHYMQTLARIRASA